MSYEDRLAERGIALPEAPQPVALYAPAVRVGALLFVSGQIARQEGRLVHPGKLGREVTLEQGREAARVAVLNVLAAARGALGSLDNIERVVRLTVYVASAEGFMQQPQVADGASELLVEVFGQAGLPARAAIGVAELPAGTCVEIEASFEVK